MKKASLLFLCFLFLFPLNIAQGQDHGVEVRLTSVKLLEIEPGRIITASFLVSNTSEQEEEYFEKLELPPGWKVIISRELPFKLKAKEQEVRLAAFFVPTTYPAGHYQITYAVRSQRNYGITDSDTFSIVVLQVVKLEILVEYKPDVVIAGEVYEVRLRVVNEGNSQTKIKLETKGNPDYLVKIDNILVKRLESSAPVETGVVDVRGRLPKITDTPAQDTRPRLRIPPQPDKPARGARIDAGRIKSPEPTTDESGYTQTDNRRRNILRSYTRAVVNDAIAKAQNYRQKGEFDKAKKALEKAKGTVNENRLYLGASIFERYSRFLEQLIEEIVREQSDAAR